jgi:trk system potassium uptake protein TrkA
MRIVIVGCGRIGSGLAQALDRAGHEIYVIDSNPAAFQRLNPAFKGKTVEGIGFDRDVLLKARIDRADAVAAVTSSDESNAVIAQLAREAYRVPKVIARMYDRQKAEIYRRLGVLTLSSTTWGIRRAIDLINYSPLNAVLSLGSGEVDLVEIEVPMLLVGRQAREMMVSGEINVAAIVRGNKTFVPTMGTTLEKGDLVYLAVATASTGCLKRLLGME